MITETIEYGGQRLLVISGRSGLKRDELLSSLASLEKRLRCPIQIMRAGRVFGKDHVESAFMKAVRAFANKDNVSDSLAMETMIYISGCRQIQEAVAFIGIGEDAPEVVCISTADETCADDITDALALQVDDGLLGDLSRKDSEAFVSGIAGIGNADAAKVQERVLERVSRVDVLKR